MPLSRSHKHLYPFTLIVVISLLVLGCRKEKPISEIDGVTGFTWKLYTLQAAGDYYINPLPDSWRFQLNNDQSFLVDLNGTTCSGNYSWNTIDSTKADVTFTIRHWNDPPQYSGTAMKWKNVLQGVNSCRVSKYPFIPQIPGFPIYASMVLQFEGTAGYFYVYR